MIIVSTGSARDMLPVGTLDGVCHLLDGLAGGVHSDAQRQQIVLARLAGLSDGHRGGVQRGPADLDGTREDRAGHGRPHLG